jgi:nucleoside-diphosphate-sugar epimerase
MVNVLVTGATGGIGRSVVPLLASRGARVVATGRNIAVGRSLETASVRFTAADLIRDDLSELVADISVVVHLAARSSPWGPASLFEADNILATTRLLDAASAAGADRFVHASTPAIFMERRHRFDLRAGSQPAVRPINDYARTKLAAERLVRAERRMATLILRPSAVLGPNDRAILPRLMRVIRRGVLHPTDVRDAAEAFVVAALGSATGAVNVAGREPVKIRDMARALADQLALRVRFPILPEPALNTIADAAEWLGRKANKEPPITSYSAAILSWSRTFNLDETETLLGWRPSFGPAQILASAAPQ